MAQPTSGAHSGQFALNKLYGHVKDTETITAAKTLTGADIGKTLFINYDTGAEIEITLPGVIAGAHFKLLWIADMDTDAAVVTLLSGESTPAGTIQGAIAVSELDGTGPSSVEDAGSATKVSIDGAPDVHAFSFLDVICDGTSWYVTGNVVTDSGSTAADCVTWDA